MSSAAVRRLQEVDDQRPRTTRAVVVLVEHGREVAAWPLLAFRRPDLGLVDDLARLALSAKRLGCTIRVRDACPELRGLLRLAGLDVVVPCEPE